jgi:cytochrome c oxidase subunit 1
LVFVANLIWSWVFARIPAGDNPWGSKSIEFQLPSPVPVHNFDRIPTFGPDPYPYGEGAGVTRPVIAPARPER